MNPGYIAAALVAFVLPIAFVVAWNFDEIVGGHDPTARPEGTLIYFYSDH